MKPKETSLEEIKKNLPFVKFNFAVSQILGMRLGDGSGNDIQVALALNEIMAETKELLKRQREELVGKIVSKLQKSFGIDGVIIDNRKFVDANQVQSRVTKVFDDILKTLEKEGKK